MQGKAETWSRHSTVASRTVSLCRQSECSTLSAQSSPHLANFKETSSFVFWHYCVHVAEHGSEKVLKERAVSKNIIDIYVQDKSMRTVESSFLLL